MISYDFVRLKNLATYFTILQDYHIRCTKKWTAKINFLSIQPQINTSIYSTMKFCLFAAPKTQKIRGPGFTSKSSEKPYISSIFTLSIMYFSQQNHALHMAQEGNKYVIYSSVWPTQSTASSIVIIVRGNISISLLTFLLSLRNFTIDTMFYNRSLSKNKIYMNTIITLSIQYLYLQKIQAMSLVHILTTY